MKTKESFSESVYFCMGRCAFRRGDGCTVMKAILQCLLGTGQPNQYGLNASRFNESENDQ